MDNHDEQLGVDTRGGAPALAGPEEPGLIGIETIAEEPTRPPSFEAPSANTAEEIEWFYVDQGAEIGPIAQARLLTLVRSGRLDKKTPVWCEGMGEWQAIAGIPALVKMLRPRPRSRFS